MKQKESEIGLLSKLITKISALNLRYLSIYVHVILPSHVLPDKNLYHKTFVFQPSQIQLLIVGDNIPGGYVLFVLITLKCFCLLC